MSARESPCCALSGQKNYATPQGVLEILRGVDFSLEAGASLA